MSSLRQIIRSTNFKVKVIGGFGKHGRAYYLNDRDTTLVKNILLKRINTDKRGKNVQS